MIEPSCMHVRELAAEMALGVLPGEERAVVLLHLTECPHCRRQVQELTVISDGLLGLVPGIEPPVGFEDRVLARLGKAERTGRWRQRERQDRTSRSERHRLRPRTPRWLPIAVAAAVAAAAFGIGGWAIGQAAGQPHPASNVEADGTLHTANLVSADAQRMVGQAFSYSGAPAWVYMVVDVDSGPSQVICELEVRGGGVVSIGTFKLDHGYGHWGAPDPVDPSTVVGAKLLGADGTVLATAKF